MPSESNNIACNCKFCNYDNYENLTIADKIELVNSLFDKLNLQLVSQVPFTEFGAMVHKAIFSNKGDTHFDVPIKFIEK